MRLLNFRAAGRDSYGVLGTRGIFDLGARSEIRAADLVAFVRAGQVEAARAIADYEHRCDYTLDDVKILSPAGRCVRYFCIGVNYPERNEEYKDGSERPRYPSLFMRSHTSFSAHGEPIVRPRESEQLDYEGELVIDHRPRRPEDSGGRGALAHLRVHLRERGFGARLAAALQVQRHAG